MGAVLPISLVATMGIAAPSATAGDSPKQPVLESRGKDVLKKRGLEFKDLNDNGEVDTYEDWRKPSEERAADLLSQMSIDQKTAMMLISTFDAEESRSEITEGQQRHFIVRDDPEPRDLAARSNEFQELAEGSELGIPVVFTSNPRNHYNVDFTLGDEEAGGQLSTWPGELGLAAARDPEMVGEFADIAAEEWRAVGVHKLYGYMADVLTEPRWTRTDGTFGEDPELAADYISEVITGFQGEELSEDSVAQTTKHFPGGGPRVDGTDPHHEWGSTNEYPTEGSLYEYHLPPFKAAVEAGTSSIMPYYAKPMNEPSADQLPEHLWHSEDQQFEEVAFAYNEGMLQGLLRDELGFEGYVNSDTGIVDDDGDRIWGVEDLTVPERYDEAMDAGTNLFSGDSDPAPLRQAVEQGLVTEDELDHSLTYTLTEMFDLGLFEDPYVDPEAAQRIADDPESQAKADEAHRDSVVLLRNDEVDGEAVLPITDEQTEDVRLYVEAFQGDPEDSAELTAGLAENFGKADDSLTIVDDPAEATHAYLWVAPSLSWREDDTEGDPPSIELREDEDTGIDHERILELQEQVDTTILGVNFTNPWVIDEIEPGADAVISTFNTTPDAIVDVIRGEHAPTGQMPFTVPADQEAVERNASDVPGYAEDFDYGYVDAAGNEWGLGFGLNYESDPDADRK